MKPTERAAACSARRCHQRAADVRPNRLRRRRDGGRTRQPCLATATTNPDGTYTLTTGPGTQAAVTPDLPGAAARPRSLPSPCADPAGILAVPRGIGPAPIQARVVAETSGRPHSRHV